MYTHHGDELRNDLFYKKNVFNFKHNIDGKYLLQY